MSTFATSAATFLRGREDDEERRTAWAMFEVTGLPSPEEEVWRYAPLSELRLDDYAVSTGPGESRPSALAQQISERAGLVIRVVDGFARVEGDVPAGLSVELAVSAPALGALSWSDRYASDPFAALNRALAPEVLVIRVAAGSSLDEPIVVVSESRSTSTFARTQIIVERGANATVVEYFEGGDRALVVPVSEYQVDQNASLNLVTYQRLSESAWHVARTTAYLERDARLRQAVVGFGASYDRSRNDAELNGAGASNELRTTFLGAGSQVHDFRTRQLHRGRRTTSTLLSKGAVADSSRSIYTGLIEIEKGAKRTDARQTNHNLLLSPLAHADSVPNLDIRENDVMCAHASSVGPLDELQRWYLESRGVRPADAQRLLIQGFFYEMLAALPPALAAIVEGDVARELQGVTVGAR